MIEGPLVNIRGSVGKDAEWGKPWREDTPTTAEGLGVSAMSGHLPIEVHQVTRFASKSSSSGSEC
jgi:hypothetical protein